MDRRNALKTLMLGAGGLIALPSWAMSWRLEDVINHTSSFTKKQLELITAVADTIIPSNGKIGALSVGVDKFLVRLIEECFEQEVQDNVKAQLAKLDDKSGKKHGKSFMNCTQKQREKLVLAFSASKKENEKDFFELMKEETIRGFETSEEVMVNYHNYEMMPGFYDGDADVETQ